MVCSNEYLIAQENELEEPTLTSNSTHPTHFRMYLDMVKAGYVGSSCILLQNEQYDYIRPRVSQEDLHALFMSYTGTESNDMFVSCYGTQYTLREITVRTTCIFRSEGGMVVYVLGSPLPIMFGVFIDNFQVKKKRVFPPESAHIRVSSMGFSTGNCSISISVMFPDAVHRSISSFRLNPAQDRYYISGKIPGEGPLRAHDKASQMSASIYFGDTLICEISKDIYVYNSFHRLPEGPMARRKEHFGQRKTPNIAIPSSTKRKRSEDDMLTPPSSPPPALRSVSFSTPDKRS